MPTRGSMARVSKCVLSVLGRAVKKFVISKIMFPFKKWQRGFEMIHFFVKQCDQALLFLKKKNEH